MILHSARLALEPLGAHHTEQVLRLCALPRVRAGAFEGRIAPQDWLRQTLQDAPQGSLWGVRPPAEPSLIGVVGLHAAPDPYTPHMVALFDPSCWGVGYAREAYACFWDWARRNLNVEHVHVLLRPDHTRAMALCEALEMQLVGVLQPNEHTRVHYRGSARH